MVCKCREVDSSPKPGNDWHTQYSKKKMETNTMILIGLMVGGFLLFGGILYSAVKNINEKGLGKK